MPGLPGTGLGGVFYALLIVWMAVREGWRALRGASDLRRWWTIGSLSAILASILLLLWLEGWLIQAAAEAFFTRGMSEDLAPRQDAEPGQATAQALVPAFAAAPFVILGLLLAVMHGARLLLPAVGTPAVGTPPALTRPSLSRPEPRLAAPATGRDSTSAAYRREYELEPAE